MKTFSGPLRSSTRALIFTSAWACLFWGSATVWPQSNTPAESEDESGQTVIVTGSRIPTIRTEGPSPVTVITSEDIEKRGFTTVLEAVSSLTQISGTVQNETDSNGFTPNAGTVNLRALGPGRTLILIDGRRTTEYPIPYNSESNFVNLAPVPAAAVERIELLSSGASAIYGSDAVAGVINIVLKKNLSTPLDLTVRLGGTSEGGGESHRIQGVGGWSNETLQFTYAAEYLHRDPIYGIDRSFMDTVADNPDPAGRINPRSLLRSDPFDLDGDGFDYIDPGSAACGPFQNMVYSTRPGRGNYCGQPNDPGQASIRNDTDRASLYSYGSWDLGAGRLYGALNLFQSVAKVDSNFSWWTPENAPYVFNVNDDPFGIGGTYNVLQRFFQPAEIGGREGRSNRYDERLVDATLGFRGNIGAGENWQYDFNLNRSQYRIKSRQRALLGAEVENYFLGPVLGVDPFLGFIPMHDFDIDRFYTPLTPDIWNSITAVNEENSRSTNNVAQLVVNGELLELPAGRIAMAAVLEYGRQTYALDPDPRLVAGDFWAFTGTGGGGERKRSALGVEFQVPIVSTLTAQLAGRYDDYNDITAVKDAFSYNFGLEYRPLKQVLLRGSLATSFRAPDMHYVFANESGFFTTVADEYLCRRDEANTPLPLCTNSAVNIRGSRSGNPGLEEETGDSYTLGFVVEPFQGFSFKADYYDIQLEGAVLDNPLDRILELEADCRLGETKGGEAVDINSAQCQNAIGSVTRLPDDGTLFAEALDTIVTGPINTADIHTSGIDVTTEYLLQTGSAGTFNFELNWTHTLEYDERDFASDPIENRRDDLQIFDWRSRVSGAVTWGFGPFTTTAYAERYGSLPNWAETGRIGSFTLVNLAAGYSFLDDRAQAIVFLNNAFNKAPPRDPSYDTYPYFAANNYSAIGREWFLQLRYNFGQ
jgi:iron complex outermembrane receptor protein